MRVLGLDPGSRRTGWGVVDKSGNRFHCAGHGCFVPAAGSPLPQRLHAIAEAAAEVMDRFRPDVVAVEEAFYHQSVRSTLVLGHVRGALIVAAVARGIEVAEYAPRAIKLAVTGNGAAAKEQVQFMVCRLLGLPAGLQPDAADALGGALCHLSRTRFAVARPASRASRELQALLAKAAR